MMRDLSGALISREEIIDKSVLEYVSRSLIRFWFRQMPQHQALFAARGYIRKTRLAMIQRRYQSLVALYAAEERESELLALDRIVCKAQCAALRRRSRKTKP